MTGEETIALRAVIRGRVQGVNYRAWCREEARRRGLAGWVQNEPDGSVKAQFAGPRAMVEDMLEAGREGPRDAAVTGIETEPLAEVPPLTEFHVNR